jgi:hypothetical protein
VTTVITHLTDIEIRFTGAVDGPPEADELTPTVLRPLLAFSNLRQLKLLAPGFRLNNAFIEDMSMAWQKIECLTLYPTMRDAATNLGGSVTIAALSSFARNCPRLNDLSLLFDATVVPQGPHPSPNGPRIRQTKLTSFRVYSSPIDSPSLVAHFLSSIFPELRDIQASYYPQVLEARERLETWKEVKKQVPFLAAARSDEEAFWTAQVARSAMVGSGPT